MPNENPEAEPNDLRFESRIVETPDVLFGKPRVRGTRISVAQVLDRLGVGCSMERLLYNFPTITERDVHACCAYASEVLEQRPARRSA